MTPHQRLEVTARARIKELTAAGARIGRAHPTQNDRELAIQCRLLTNLTRTGQQQPPDPAAVRWVAPATYQISTEVLYNTAVPPADWR